MPTGYVVVNRYFAYNDEIYSGEDAGTPTRIFLNQQQAEEYALDLNIKKIQYRDFSLSDYYYDDPKELMSPCEHRKNLSQVLGEDC